jgi:fibronectin type 3 domain-containing protein
LIVEFFDSLLCIGKLGEGSPNDFELGGIMVNVAVNAQTSVYARSRDAAGNTSGCIHMVDYIYNNLVPAQPIFLSALPASPSYSRETRLRGTFGSSPDFMNRVSVGVYSDSSCLTEVASDVPSVFQSAGILVVAPDNATTQFYGASFNEVGTKSNCNLLTSFRHHDLPIANLQLSSSLDGGVAISWLPDSLASPTPSYAVERSLSAQGPFSVIQSGLMANSHSDKMVSDSTRYYYRVFASNSTGRGQYSEVRDILISSPPPVQAISLLARGSTGRVELSWSGFPQNMSYKIMRSTSEGGPYTQLPQIVTTTSFIDMGLTPDTEYYYVVVGFNAAGESLHSNMASAVTWDVPWSPSELGVRVLRSHTSCDGNPALALSWNPPAYYDSFSVMRGGWSSYPESVITVTGTEAIICDINEANGLRAYAVRTNWGTGVSGFSNPVGYHSAGDSNLSVFPGEGKILLNWTVPTTDTAFQTLSPRFDIYKSSQPEGPFVKLVENTMAFSYLDEDVVDGAPYFYYVQTYTINALDQKAYVAPPSSTRSGTPGVPPTAPSNLTLGESSSGQLVLYWSSPTHFNRFHLYRSASPGGPFSRILSTDLRSITNPSVSVGLNYFQIRAQWGDGETDPSNTVVYRHAPVTGLAATRGVDEIGLSWNPVAGFAEYRIYRSESFSGPYALLTTTGTESYVDSSALENIGYYYKVGAYFSDGTEGLPSNPVGSSRLGNSVPRAVSVDILSPTSFLVNWIGAVPSTPHQVLLSEEEEGSYILKASGIQGPLIVGGLTPQTQYYIKVRVIVDSVNYDSAPVMAETLPPPAPPLASAGDGVVNLSWAPMIGAISYDLQRSEDSFTFTNVATSLGTTSYADASVDNGKIYFYRIRVNFPLGSVLSGHSGAVTPGVQPRTPRGLMVVDNSLGTEIRLSWAREEAANRYNIYQASTSGGFTIPTQNAGGNSTQITGLTAGETYYFAVSSVTGSFESSLSSEIAVVAGLQMAAPIGQVDGPDSIELTWDAVAGADSYNLYRSTDKYFFELVSSGIGATTYTDSGLDPNPSYFYQVLPIGPGGEIYPRSATSAPVMISVDPMTPRGLSLSAINDSAVDIRWIYTPNVVGYELLRSEVSGGPYSLVASPGPLETLYQDTAVVAGSTYFYVIRSVSPSGVRSANSGERGIRLVSAPENLVAINGSEGIDLSWDSVPGAVSYQVRRSAYTGAAMGMVASPTVLSWTDEETFADIEYTYVVEAVFADNTISPRSDQVSLVRSGNLRLQVPIELIDTRLGSSALEEVAFARSQTSLNTDFYDGVNSYELEIVARNLDGVARSVALIDSGDIELTSISVPPGTSDYTRFKMAFSPNMGDEVYRLKLDQTNSNLDLAVWAARILVNQENASKTRLYFPLLTTRQAPSQEDLESFIYSTAETGFQPLETSIPFERRASRLFRIVDYNAWELEALVSVTGDVGGALVFRNTNTQVDVPSTYTRFESSHISMARIPFSEGINQFGATQEGHLYEVQLKCEYQCHTGEASLYKSGLWVTLENLDKAEVVFRNAGARSSVTVSEAFAQERTLFNGSAFTSPEVHLTAVAQGAVGFNGEVYLVEHMDDSGGAGLVSVPGSGLVFNTGARQVQTTASPLALTESGRIITAVDPDSGEVDFIGSLLKIQVNP